MFPEGRALEILLAGVVALIVIGPKDLPVMLRKLGQFMAKVRGMAAEFRASFDEMARQSELDELRKEVEAMRNGQMADMAGSHADLGSALGEINQGISDGIQLHPPMSYQYEAAQTAADVPVAKTPRARKPVGSKTAAPKAKTTAKPRVKATTPASPKPRVRKSTRNIS